ncbi:hypothetical protein C0W38_14445 [Photobacterium angustum]|nr:hypothetical protein CTM95_11665 [Photobacterium angustum]PSW94470.1 hypothetical protein C0W79_14335 [Photobacterium angustum]PSX03211.1 hypothetical protein C0W87_06350 [Photobacterium angustum]PSX34307.1 hypothetical protein C0W38_14445 [Photobacterium angustum]
MRIRMNNNKLIGKLADLLILLPIFWSFSGLFIFKDGDKILVILTLLSLFISIYKFKLNLIKENIKNYQFLLYIITLTLLSLVYKHYEGNHIINLRVSLSIIIIYLSTPKCYFKSKLFPFILLVSSVAAASYAFWQHDILHLARESWTLNAIPYSACCLILFIIASIKTLYAKDSFEKVLLFLSSLVSLYAIFISETRGVLIAAIMQIILVSFVYFKSQTSKKVRLLAILFLTISLTSIIYVNKDRLIDNTLSEYSKIEKGNTNTSIGLRLDMWKAALLLVKDKPLLGYGNHYHSSIEKLYRENKISEALYHFPFQHFHNQFLDYSVRYGVIGLLLLAIFIVLPSYLISNTSYTIEQKMIIYMTSLGIIIACLTDVPLSHKQVFALYSLIMLQTLNYKKGS